MEASHTRSSVWRAAMFYRAACVWLLLAVSSVTMDTSDTKNVTVKPGENATLTCYAPRDATVRLLQWSRPDLKSDQYVYFNRHMRAYEHYQLAVFRGRVELGDPQMRDGNVSVVLTNATVNDTGTYECRVSADRRTKRDKPTSVIYLTVKEPGPTDGGNRDGLVAGLSVVGVVTVGVVSGLVIWRKSNCHQKETPAVESAR